MRYGYFDNENREYVISQVDVPVSWTNYLGVKNMCTVISQNAGGYSFYRSPDHALSSQRYPFGPARPLRLPARRSDGRVLVYFLAAGRQGSAAGAVRMPA